MKTRIITAIVALCLFLPILYFSHTIAFAVAVSVLSAVAVWEIGACFGQKKHIFAYFPAYIIAIGAPVLAFYYPSSFFKALILAFFVYAFYTLAYAMFSAEKVKILDMMSVFAYSFYAIFGFSSMVLLRSLEAGAKGQYLLLLVFFAAWFTDTGAYFIGVFFGKHKLIPRVSPKKTVEGAFGGILGAVIGYLGFGLVVKLAFEATPDFLYLAIGAIIAAAVSQIGDLIASAVKRTQGIKDYGFVFPGHGGVLDRFDSAIAVAPFLYLLSELSVKFF